MKDTFTVHTNKQYVKQKKGSEWKEQTSSNGALLRPASQFLPTAEAPEALGFLAEPFLAALGGIFTQWQWFKFETTQNIKKNSPQPTRALI